MKKLKHVKTFESFKLNEEVPFNQDEFKRNFNQEEWTQKEKSDLHKLGADEMGKSSAIFRQKGFDVTVSKHVSNRGTEDKPRVYYYAVNSLSQILWDKKKGDDYMKYRWQYEFAEEFRKYYWDDFLSSLSSYINRVEKELEHMDDDMDDMDDDVREKPKLAFISPAKTETVTRNPSTGCLRCGGKGCIKCVKDYGRPWYDKIFSPGDNWTSRH